MMPCPAILSAIFMTPVGAWEFYITAEQHGAWESYKTASGQSGQSC